MSPRRTLAAILVAVSAVAAGAVRAEREAPQATAPAPRVVSLVPAATEMLFAIGAGPQVIGVSSFDTYPPEVASRPRVGALVDPDIERILQLRPNLVVVYASQEELIGQLQRTGITPLVYRHGGLSQITQMMRDLGQAVGRAPAAEHAVRTFAGSLDRIAAAVAGKPRPRVLLVFGRDPFTLRNVYASGGTGFLHDAIVAAGGRNVFEDTPRESVQASTELILARSPDVIVEVRGTTMLEGAKREQDAAAWNRLASLPAVRAKRVYLLNGGEFVVPGPRFPSAVERLARAIHPEAW